MASHSRQEVEGRAVAGIQPAAYRLPNATRLGRVRIIVSNLKRSLEYYESVLGMRVIARQNATLVQLGAHGSDRILVELEERPNIEPLGERRRRLGIYHFALLLPDRAALGSFAAHLGRIGAYAGSADHLVSEAFYLVDPDGITIEVYADRPRSAWSYEGRELVMSTDPLDMRSLLQAGAQTPWRGLPAGTTMGHVHFYVGDLQQAQAFYHAALGMDLMNWSLGSALFVAAGGYHHHVGLNTWAARSPVASEEDARLLDWELIVPTSADVTAVAASLVAAGFEAVASPDQKFRFRDPWGIAVAVVAADSLQ